MQEDLSAQNRQTRPLKDTNLLKRLTRCTAAMRAQYENSMATQKRGKGQLLPSKERYQTKAKKRKQID